MTWVLTYLSPSITTQHSVNQFFGTYMVADLYNETRKVESLWRAEKINHQLAKLGLDDVFRHYFTWHGSFIILTNKQTSLIINYRVIKAGEKLAGNVIFWS